MIKFFRKIRQRLLSESKFSKYMLYAIGEIVLVVIGILIAVQINDWNEHRKLNLTNHIQLRKMVEELKANMARMDLLSTNSLGTSTYGYPSQAEAVANCDSLLRLTYIGLTEKDVPFICSGRFHTGTPSLNLIQDVFDEMKSTGRLNTIGSDSLVAAIKNYNKRYVRETYYNNMHHGHVIRALSKIEDGFGKLTLDHQMDPDHFEIENYDWYFDKRSEEYQNIQVAFAAMLDSQSQTLEKMLDIHTLSEELILMIERELESHQE